MTRARIVSLLSVSLALGGCAHKPAAEAKAVETPPASAAAPAPASSKPPTAPAADAARTCSKDDDCPLAALCIRTQCVAITPEVVLAECSVVRVHFDFDAWLIRDEEKPALQRVARCLRADQKLHVTIEGNADERGTEEYNLQLGAKRATVVERFLEALGVSDPQLKTISYGVEKPLCTEHNEACWAQNRRAGVRVQPGSN